MLWICHDNSWPLTRLALLAPLTASKVVTRTVSGFIFTVKVSPGGVIITGGKFFKEILLVI